MTTQEISDRIRHELRAAERWGSAVYPCAVAMTEDQKGEFILAYTRHVRFSPEDNLLVWGLPVAIVPDSWKGPVVLLAAKV